MKLLKKGFFCMAIGSAFMVMSCANESPWGSSNKADGKIYLNLTADGSVNEATRSDGVSPYVPHPSEFTITLQSTDGSYSNSWKSLDAFNNEAGFPMGSYKITASFGEDSQEGFMNPYFYGESTVNVSLGESSDVNITARLANSMVSIKYDDNFSEFFPAHSSAIETTGNSPVVFVQNETRPAYITSGTVNLKLTLTDEKENTITVSPSNFIAEPRKHYIVTFGVDGNVDRGYGMLTVEYSEDLVSEDKSILLTEELFTEPAPTVELKGSDANLDLIEGLDYEDVNPEFHISAYGGLSTMIMHLTADDTSKLPACGANVVLVGENAITKGLAEANGIDCAGIFDKTGDMAVINIKELVKSLQPGNYTVSLEMEDGLGRTTTSDNTLQITVTGLEYKFISYEKPNFLDKEITVVVTSNVAEIKDQLKFKSLNSNDVLEDVTFSVIPDYSLTNQNGSLEYTFAYKLDVSEIDNFKWKVGTYVPSRTLHEMDIDVNMPTFNLECDAFAKWVRIRPETSTESSLATRLIEKGLIYKGDNKISDYEVENGIIFLRGLTPGQFYNDYTLSLGSGLYEGYKNNIKFTTEKGDSLPNADFSVTSNLLVDPIDVGGPYETRFTIFASHQQITSSINRNVPADQWATLNDLTCYSQSSNKNTWYMEPSTFLDNGKVVIRTVGYNHNGRTLEESKNGTSRIYYGKDKPSSGELNKSIGELFLGEYSYNGSPDRKDGIPFSSRPSSLKFTYSYTSKNDEKGFVYIKIIDNTGTVISQNEEELISAMDTEKTLFLMGYPFGVKCSKIEIGFKSSSNSENPYIEFPASLDEGRTDTTYLDDEKKNPNDYITFAMGSELKVSNIELVY